MSAIFTSPDDAEEAFYDAINRADLEALMSVWANEEEIVCIHPTGQRLTGPTAIRESWRGILTSDPRLKVHVMRTVRWKGVILAVHSVVERVYLGEDATQHSPMLSTNVFQRGANGWRLLTRHTSTAIDASVESADEGPDNLTRTLH